MASIVGLYAGEDVSLGDVLFNKVTDNQCAWVITDIDGWWGLPDVSMPDDPRPSAEDGSYYATGRFLPRDLSLRGHILPMDGVSNKTVAARSELNRVLGKLARGRVLLQVSEDIPKVAMVQLAGMPLTRISAVTGLLEFDIPLRAVDPAKYGKTQNSLSTTLGATSPGRVYNKEFLYTYGGATSSGIITAQNIGTYETSAIMTISGPVTRPRIEHIETGNYLEFNTVLNVGETIEINTKSKKILQGGASRRNTLTRQSSWFNLQPGTNSIRYSGTQQVPAQEGNPGGTNLATNPSFETSDSTFEYRRNYATAAIPSGSLAYNWANGVGQVSSSSGIITGATDGPLPGVTSYQRRVITTPKTGGTDGFYLYTGAPINPAVGEVATPSVYVRSSHTIVVALIGSWRASGAGAQVGTTTTSGQLTLPAGEWVRLSTPAVTALAGAVNLGWWATFPSGAILPAGAVVDATAFLAEKSSTLNDYFNGSVTPDSDYTPSWTGTVNGSASILTGNRVASVSGRSKLSTWYSAVRSGKAQAIIIGDSISQGGTASVISNRWQTLAQNAIRNGTTGATYPFLPANMQNSAWGIGRTGTITSNSAYGLSWYTLALVDDTSKLTFLFTGDRCKVMYTKSTTQGIMKVSIDGGTPVSISQNGTAASAQIWDSGVLAQGDHTVVITRDSTSVAGQSVFIEGLLTYNGDHDAGVRFLDASHSGYSTNEMVTASRVSNMSQSLSSAGGADLAIIAFGTNDYGTGVSPSVYKSNTLSTISTMRSQGFSGPILLVGMYMGGGRDLSLWQQYLDALAEISVSDAKVDFIDLRDFMPDIPVPYNAPSSEGLFADGLHPNDLGHQRIANAIVSYIMPSGGVQSTKWASRGTKSLRVLPGEFATVSVQNTTIIKARNPGQTATLGRVSKTSLIQNEVMSIPGSGVLVLGPGWWDELGIGIPVYFDGSSPGASWTGTPNASTSTSPVIPEVPKTMLQLQYRDAWID